MSRTSNYVVVARICLERSGVHFALGRGGGSGAWGHRIRRQCPLVGLCLLLWCFAGSGQSPESNNSSLEYLKSFIVGPPAIRMLVLERTVESKSLTNAYLVRYQNGDYFVREVMHASETFETVPARPEQLIAGRNKGQNWGYLFGYLHVLGPGNVDNRAAGGARFADMIVGLIRCYGIVDLDPLSIRWTEAGSFVGRSVRNEVIEGQVVRSTDGKVTSIDYATTSANGFVRRVRNLLNYGDASWPCCYPREIVCEVKSDGSWHTSSRLLLHQLEFADTPLGQELFGWAGLERSGVISNNIIGYTNDIAFAQGQRGSYRLQPSSTQNPLLIQSPEKGRRSVVILLLALSTLAVVAFLFWPNRNRKF